MTDPPIASWEGLPTDQLASRWGVPRVLAFPRVGSTNDVVRSRAAAGEPAGLVALAEEQTAGRGRAGRGWASPPGLGLWMTLLLRPNPEAATAPFSLLAGLACAEALDAVLPPGAVRLKWPNDLVVQGRKLGGILCEATWDGPTMTALVVGVGINVLQQPDDFAPELRSTGTSVRLAGGPGVTRLAVASAVVPTLHARLADAAADPGWHRRLESRDALRGRVVEVTEPTTGAPLARGTAEGIDGAGALLVRTSEGRLRQIRSGTVRLAASGT